MSIVPDVSLGFNSKKQIYAFMFLFLFVLGVFKHLPVGLGSYLLSALVVFQMYGPIYWVERKGFSIEYLGLSEHFFKNWKKIGWDWFAVSSFLTFVPFALCVHWYCTRVLQLHFYFAWPDSLFKLVITQFLAVALPEELFYRGFILKLLTSCDQKIDFLKDMNKPNRHEWSVCLALFISTFFFAMSHFVGEYNPARLATFFPGLVMGFLFQKTRYLYASIAYHACANILSEWLFVCYS